MSAGKATAARASGAWAGRNFPLLPVLGLVLALTMAASLTMGRYPLGLWEVLRLLATTNPFGASGTYADKAFIAVELVRLPRVLLVTLCGMGLALSGAAMQGVFRNPLVGPEVTGVTSGAALGGVAALMFGVSVFGVVGLAFCGGLLALACAFALATLAGREGTLALVLSGVIVGGFCSAVVGLLELVADPTTQLPSIVFWLLGSFVGATYDKAAVAAAALLAGGAPLLLLRWRINLLALGTADARALGVRVEALRWAIMGLVTLIVAAQVSVSGGVGWVGLIVPHLARVMVGPDHSRLLPASALLGGLYLLAMDDLARSALASEIPIGLLTSLLGTPVFAILFWRVQCRGWHQL
jgi:iron complex transport system permease protein